MEISVENLEEPQVATEETPAVEEPVVEEPQIVAEETPVLEPVIEEIPKKRGRPKGAVKMKPVAPVVPVAKPKGRPKKVTVIEEPPPIPIPTEADLQSYVTPLLQAYAAHLHMNHTNMKRKRYQELFSNVIQRYNET